MRVKVMNTFMDVMLHFSERLCIKIVLSAHKKFNVTTVDGGDLIK